MARRRRAVNMIERMTKKRKLETNLILDEEPIAVVVQGSKFYIHKSLLRNQSENCHEALSFPPVTPPWPALCQTNNETFSSFSQWLYSGNLAVAEMKEELAGLPELDDQDSRRLTNRDGDGAEILDDGQCRDDTTANTVREAEATQQSHNNDTVSQSIDSPNGINSLVCMKSECEGGPAGPIPHTTDTEVERDEDASISAQAVDEFNENQLATTVEQNAQQDSDATDNPGPAWMAEGLDRQQRVFARIVDLYIFGQMYCSVSFRREAMLMLQRFIAVVRNFPGISVVKYALEQLGMESPLSTYLVVCYSAVGEGSDLTSISTLNAEFLGRVVQLLYKRIQGRPIPYWKEHWCDFHEHETLKECIACEQERADDIDVRRKQREM